MTKLETESYYSAIGRKHDLLCIDSTEDEEQLKTLLQEKIADGLERIDIVVFYEDTRIYTCFVFPNDQGVMNVYANNIETHHGIPLDTTVNAVIESIPSWARNLYDRYLAKEIEPGVWLTKSFSQGPDYAIDLNSSLPDEPVLGIYVHDDEQMKCHPVYPPDQATIAPLTRYLKHIKNNDIRMFTKTCLNLLQPYSLYVPASAKSGKRPAGNIAPGGLLRHLAETAEMVRMLMAYNRHSTTYSSRKEDLMLSAALLHDFLHRGWQEDYEKDPSIKFNHPVIAAEALRCVKNILQDDSDLEFLTKCIACHMGYNNIETNSVSRNTRPKPRTKDQHLVSLANYLVTRGKIGMILDNNLFAYDDQNVNYISRSTAIDETSMTCIQNALLMPIDIDTAKANGIQDSEDTIRSCWSRIIKNCWAEESDIRYITLAKQMTLL